MLRLAAALTLSLLTVSCTGFPRGWSEARQSMPADPVSGAWVGTWQSDVNGHRGGLRAVAEAKGGGVWHFRYRASWAKVLCGGFAMDATVRPDGKGGQTVRGGQDLGAIFGGVFTCDGTIRDGQFSARYDSKFDRGVMEMRRLNTGR